MFLFDREKKRPGSVTSLIPLMVAFIMLVLALCGGSRKVAPLRNIYMAQFDLSETNWRNVLVNLNNPEVNQDWKSSTNFFPIQRYSLWNNCLGYNRDGFVPYLCGRTETRKSLNVRYYMANAINPFVANHEVEESDIYLSQATEVDGPTSGAANAFLIMSVVLIGISIVLQLFSAPSYDLQKVSAAVALFISNVISNVTVVKMVHSFQNHYGRNGISAQVGKRYFALVWTAFALLVFSALFEYSYRQFYKYRERRNNKGNARNNIGERVVDQEKGFNSEQTSNAGTLMQPSPLGRTKISQNH